MAHIIVNPETDIQTGRITGGARFELPESDLSTLPENLAKGMRGQASVTVAVLVDGSNALLVLNGNTVSTMLYVP
jgi:hypothetical protein